MKRVFNLIAGALLGVLVIPALSSAQSEITVSGSGTGQFATASATAESECRSKGSEAELKCKSEGGIPALFGCHPACSNFGSATQWSCNAIGTVTCITNRESNSSSTRWLLDCEDLAETRPWHLTAIIGKNLLQESATVTFSRIGEGETQRTGSFLTRPNASSVRDFSVQFDNGETFLSRIDLATYRGTGYWNKNSTLKIELNCMLSELY